MIAPAAASFAPIASLLSRARARQRRIVVFSGLFFAVGLFFLAMPAVLAFASTSNPLSRVALLMLVAASAVVFAITGLLRARRHVGDPSSTAILLASRTDSEALRRGLVPAVELAAALAKEQDHAFSETLAQAHIASVAEAAPKIDLTRVLPDLPMRRAGLGALGASLVFLILVLFFAGPMARGARFLVSEPLVSGKAQAAVEPITGEIELSFVYPAYTHLASRTLPNTNGEISAPRGTEISFKTRADREVAKAFLVMGETAMPLTVKNSRDLSGGLLVSRPGSYHFRFADERGRVIAEGPPIPIAVEEDAAPKSTITSPSTDIEVDPKSRVPIRFEAEDDYGLSEVALLFKLPGAKKPTRVVLKRTAEGPRRASGEYQWDIVAQGLSAGDSVAYYLESTDNDTVSGKKTGVSKTQYLKIYSEAEHHRQILKRIEEKWEQLILVLADRMEGPEHSPKDRTQERVLAGSSVDVRAMALAKELQELAAALKKEKAPEQLRRALLNVAQGISEKGSATADARNYFSVWAKRGTTLEAPQMRRLEVAVNAEIVEEEKDVLYLETLLDQQRIQDLMTLTHELAARRRDLAGLLEQYRKAPNDETKEKIEREIGRLKERMDELMRRMSELSKSINDEHMNAEAMKEMAKENEMMNSFDKIQELMHQGKIEEAMKELEKLGQQMDKMEEQLKKASGDYKGGEFSEVGKELNEFAKDLDALKDDQEDLLKQAQDVRQNYKKQLQDRLAQKGPEFVNKLRQKVEKAKQRLGEVPDDNSADRFGTDELKAAKEDLENLDRALAVQDFDQAEQSATRSLKHSLSVQEDLERQVGDAQRYQQYGKRDVETLKKSQKSAQAAIPPQEEIEKELKDLFPSPSEMMTAEDRDKMKKQAEKQGQMQQKANQLGQKMDQLGKKAPIFSPSSQEMMKQAGQRMQRAQGQLSGRNPTGAMAEERAALDQLSQLKKGLEKQGGQGQPGESGPSMPWPWMGQGQPGEGGEQEGTNGDRPPGEKVEIPGADAYQVPEEYRKDILDAMKQQAPEKYKEQVKRYYEEIVK